MEVIILLIAIAILAETTYLTTRKNTVKRAVISGDSRNILLDTSVLIDGRIIDIVKAGFAPGTLQVPRSVIGELQLLADGNNDEKRARARFGLETLAALREVAPTRVAIYEDETNAPEGVDARLRSLAVKEKFELCTLDFNLLKVAEIDGITVLNINDLSNTLRMIHLPGEQVELFLQQKGQERSQAVGYAEDGTMVVVENSISLLGQRAKVEIIRSIQTSSGRMMFAKLVNAQANSQPPKQERQNDQPKEQPQRAGRGRGGRNQRPPKSLDAPVSTEPVTAAQVQVAPQPERPRQQPRPPRPPREPAVQAEGQNTDAVAPKLQNNRSRRSRRGPSAEDELLQLVDKQ